MSTPTFTLKDHPYVFGDGWHVEVVMVNAPTSHASAVWLLKRWLDPSPTDEQIALWPLTEAHRWMHDVIAHVLKIKGQELQLMAHKPGGLTQ